MKTRILKIELDRKPIVGDVCSNAVHPYFMWTQEHVNINAINMLPEYKNTKVKQLIVLEQREPKLNEWMSDGKIIVRNKVQLDGYINIYPIVIAYPKLEGTVAFTREFVETRYIPYNCPDDFNIACGFLSCYTTPIHRKCDLCSAGDLMKQSVNTSPFAEHIKNERLIGKGDAQINAFKSIIEGQEKAKNPFVLKEVFADNGTHSHWTLIQAFSGVKVWSEDPEECKAMGYPVEPPDFSKCYPNGKPINEAYLPLEERKKDWDAGYKRACVDLKWLIEDNVPTKEEYFVEKK